MLKTILEIETTNPAYGALSVRFDVAERIIIEDNSPIFGKMPIHVLYRGQYRQVLRDQGILHLEPIEIGGGSIENVKVRFSQPIV